MMSLWQQQPAAPQRPDQQDLSINMMRPPLLCNMWHNSEKVKIQEQLNKFRKDYMMRPCTSGGTTNSKAVKQLALETRRVQVFYKIIR